MDYAAIKHTAALSAYCEAQGIKTIETLQVGTGEPPKDNQVSLACFSICPAAIKDEGISRSIPQTTPSPLEALELIYSQLLDITMSPSESNSTLEVAAVNQPDHQDVPGANVNAEQDQQVGLILADGVPVFGPTIGQEQPTGVQFATGAPVFDINMRSASVPPSEQSQVSNASLATSVTTITTDPLLDAYAELANACIFAEGRGIHANTTHPGFNAWNAATRVYVPGTHQHTSIDELPTLSVRADQMLDTLNYPNPSIRPYLRFSNLEQAFFGIELGEGPAKPPTVQEEAPVSVSGGSSVYTPTERADGGSERNFTGHRAHQAPRANTAPPAGQNNRGGKANKGRAHKKQHHQNADLFSLVGRLEDAVRGSVYLCSGLLSPRLTAISQVARDPHAALQHFLTTTLTGPLLASAAFSQTNDMGTTRVSLAHHRPTTPARTSNENPGVRVPRPPPVHQPIRNDSTRRRRHRLHRA
jgi:hypothetical protein